LIANPAKLITPNNTIEKPTTRVTTGAMKTSLIAYRGSVNNNLSKKYNPGEYQKKRGPIQDYIKDETSPVWFPVLNTLQYVESCGLAQAAKAPDQKMGPKICYTPE